MYAFVRVVFFFFFYTRERERKREKHISHMRARLYRIASPRYTSQRYEIRENVRDRAFENIRRAEADEWRPDAQHGEKLTSLGKSGTGKCAAGCGAE